jgi:hypothetical protein
VRCCGAGCGVPGKGWERTESRNGQRDTAASVAALRPGNGRALSVIPAMADRPLNWIGNAQARRLDSAGRSARAANGGRKPSSGHPSRGAATHLSPDPLRMGRQEAPLGRVDCPYAAEPETSNLQRLFIYGVSPGMASRNFRAHRKGGDHLRGILLRKSKRSCSLPEFGEGEETARPGSPKPHSGEEMAAAFKIA